MPALSSRSIGTFLRLGKPRPQPESLPTACAEPAALDATNRAAWQCLAAGRLDRAISIHQRLIEVDPAPQLRNRTGDLMARADQTGPAIDLFLEVADEYYQGGFLKKARAVYRKILRLDPLHTGALTGLAMMEIEASPFGSPLKPAVRTVPA